MSATNPIKKILDYANLNTLADFFKKLKIGAILRAQLPQVLRQQIPAADSSQLATVKSLGVVAKGATAASIMRARAWTGGVTALELAIQAYGTTPGSGQIAVAPNGDIVVLASDAWTDLDVTYQPERGDVVVLPELPVVAGVLTLPSSVLDSDGTRRAILLLSAQATAGAVIGQKIVLIPAGTKGAPALPATTKAQLSLDGQIVEFNNATDAVTKAIVTLLIVSADDLDTLLESESAIL
jgi:hypothetical protein